MLLCGPAAECSVRAFERPIHAVATQFRSKCMLQPRTGDRQAGQSPLPPARARCRRRSFAASSAAHSEGDSVETEEEVSAVTQRSSIDQEVASIALPTLATLAADPLASLVSTWYVGLLGTQPLASAGVALSLFNSATKLLNMPLLAVTTSSVAQAVGAQQASQSGGDGGGSSALGTAISASLTLALLTGAAQAALLLAVGQRGLAAWGAGPGGPLYGDAAAYLSARALAAPATVLMLVLQGCFRGLGDTRTPFLATALSNLLNVALEPLLIFWAGWGVRGAAAAVGLSQAAACVVLVSLLCRRYRLQLGGLQSLSRSLGYLRSTGFLALRTLAVMGVYSLATSTAARTDPAHAASHQIAFQVWLASSLLADSLAVAAQTLMARSLAAGKPRSAAAVVRSTLRMAALLGCALAAGLALGQGAIAHAFSRDPAVLRALGLIMPFVVLTQPINALAFLMDGILYGADGFGTAAVTMVAACLPAGAIMLLGSRLSAGLAGTAGTAGTAGPALHALAPADGRLLAVWAGLALLMLLRFLTIYWPLRRRSGPFVRLVA